MSLRRAPIVLTTALLATTLAAPAAASSTFGDVAGSVHEPAITALAEVEIVAGCDEDRFCPQGGLTRGQVASLLARALELDTTSDGAGRFTDTAGSVHAGAIDAIAAAGLTRGCTSDAYCPNDPVSRGQLATLLQRAFDLPAAPDDRYFDDIEGSVHASAIESLAASGVAKGCTAIAFCPGHQLTRAQGATFVARAAELVDRVELDSYDRRRQTHEQERAERAARAETEAGQRAADVALDQVGTPYRYGGNGPSGFDCSGLTSYAWRAAGVDLPRTSSDQHRATTRIDRGDLRPGDLIFYRDPVGHVAMYVGDGQVVEAPSSGKTVRVSSSSLSRSDITGYGRPS